MNQLESKSIGGLVVEPLVKRTPTGNTNDSHHLFYDYQASIGKATLRISGGSIPTLSPSEGLDLIQAKSMGLNIEVKEKYSAPSIELYRSSGLCADLEVSKKLSAGKEVLLEKIAVTHNPFQFKSILRVKNLSINSNLLPKKCGARFNSYTVESLNRENRCLDTSRLDSFPGVEYLERFRDRPNVTFVNVYLNLDLFLPTTDRSCDAWRWLPGEPVSLVRTIEVWHYQLTKRRTSELFAKLARSTHIKRASLPGILGNWLKKDCAKKEQDFWTFDVTKLLEYYKLKPLTPEAIEAFKLRGKAFQARYN